MEPLKWNDTFAPQQPPAETAPLHPQLGLQEIGNNDGTMRLFNSRERNVMTHVHIPAPTREETTVEAMYTSSSSASEEITALRVQQEKMRWLMFRQQLQLQQLQQMQAMAAFATAQQQKSSSYDTLRNLYPAIPVDVNGPGVQSVDATLASKDVSTSPIKAKKQCKLTMWKDENRPKRPLTAYNLFFKHERAMMLADAEKAAIDQLKAKPSARANTNKFDDAPSYAMADICFVESDLDRSAQQYERENDKKRPAWDSVDASTSDQGDEVAADSQLIARPETRIWTKKIGFADMGREIAKRWRAADMETRTRFQTMADEDKARYVLEKEEYLQRKNTLPGDHSQANHDSH